MTHQATISDLTAAAVLRRLADGFRGTQALLVAAELGIADHLAAEPLPASELAKRTATDAEALRRLMRALCALGVFTEQASGYFAHNSVSHLLRIDVDGSLNAVIQFLAGPLVGVAGDHSARRSELARAQQAAFSVRRCSNITPRIHPNQRSTMMR